MPLRYERASLGGSGAGREHIQHTRRQGEDNGRACAGGPQILRGQRAANGEKKAYRKMRRVAERQRLHVCVRVRVRALVRTKRARARAKMLGAGRDCGDREKNANSVSRPRKTGKENSGCALTRSLDAGLDGASARGHALRGRRRGGARRARRRERMTAAARLTAHIEKRAKKSEKNFKKTKK